MNMPPQLASQCRMMLAPRSRTGCLTCRRRHKKCDESHPRCTGCTRNHLLCRWPDDLTRASESSEIKHTKPASQIVSTTTINIRQPSMLPPLFRSERNSFLLQHFAEVTSVQLASRVVPENAYLIYNLRLAWEGDGIQHAVLAISSSHVSYIHSSCTSSSLGHYVVALRWVKHAITRWASSSSMVHCLIVATSLALCQYEVLNANQEGSLYHHLRGLKFMISQLDHHGRVHDPDLLGFFAEQYHYLTIVSHLGFDLTFAPLDWKPADRFAIHSLTTLNKGRPIYGFMFGRAHSLFALIPSVHSLAVQCWHERRPVRVELEVMYLTLLSQIARWEEDDDTSHAAYRIAGRMYQQALLIFLHVGFSGPEALSLHLFCQVDRCIETFLMHSEELPQDALTRTTTMWPFLVSGSCMLREDQRCRLLAMLDDPTVKFPVLKCMRDSLVLFWTELDRDSGLYGPHGLEITLKKHRIVLCIG